MCSGGAVRGRGHGGEGGQEVAARDADAGRVDQQLLIAVVDLRVRSPHRPQRRLRAQRLSAASPAPRDIAQIPTFHCHCMSQFKGVHMIHIWHHKVKQQPGGPNSTPGSKLLMAAEGSWTWSIRNTLSICNTLNNTLPRASFGLI